jgi:hypothetical protein
MNRTVKMCRLKICFIINLSWSNPKLKYKSLNASANKKELYLNPTSITGKDKFLLLMKNFRDNLPEI